MIIFDLILNTFEASVVFEATGVNFINILRTHFLYKRQLSSLSLVTFGFVIFGAKILFEKCASKMLMKLIPGKKFETESNLKPNHRSQVLLRKISESLV